MTASELLAIAMNRTAEGGSGPCFWCGASGTTGFHPPQGFTMWGDVAHPASWHICAGCMIATDEANKSRRPRMMSWRITELDAKAVGRFEIGAIREWCVEPPAVPFAICVPTSGQKHLIYRAPVNWSQDEITVQFETERVTYRLQALRDRIGLCEQIAAATGKPALKETPRGNLVARLSAHYGNIEPLLHWWDVANEPLSRLAAHLCRPKEQCLEHYPCTVASSPTDVRRGGMAAKTGGPDGPGLFGD